MVEELVKGGTSKDGAKISPVAGGYLWKSCDNDRKNNSHTGSCQQGKRWLCSLAFVLIAIWFSIGFIKNGNYVYGEGGITDLGHREPTNDNSIAEEESERQTMTVSYRPQIDSERNVEFKFNAELVDIHSECYTQGRVRCRIRRGRKVYPHDYDDLKLGSYLAVVDVGNRTVTLPIEIKWGKVTVINIQNAIINVVGVPDEHYNLHARLYLAGNRLTELCLEGSNNLVAGKYDLEFATEGCDSVWVKGIEVEPGQTLDVKWYTKGKEPIPCCELKDNLITWPVTTDPLEPPDIQEAMQEPAVGAYNVFLNNGSFFESVEDMMIPALGTDFHMARTYRSNVKTKAGGLIGHKWDFAFNKRIVPVPPRVNCQGLAEEVKDEDTPQLYYYNGLGRRDLFKEKHSGPRGVFNWDTHFKAYVTTYDSPPGMFFEIQRYVILEGEHPFIEHDNVKEYEKIFYVLRLKNGHQYIFNCRGQIIYIIDRHGLRMTFVYQGPLNPLTQNKMLSKITDASGRGYSFGFKNIGEGTLNTNIDCQKVTDTVSIPRFKTVTDFDGRKIVYNYKDNDSKPILESVNLEFKTGTRTFKYEYDKEYNIKSITDPESQRYIRNKYDSKGRVEKQKYGTNLMTIKYVGTTITVTDARATEREFLLSSLEDDPVVKQLTIKGQGSGSFKGSWTTSFKHNGDGQITEVKNPSGRRTTLKYASNGGPIKNLGKVRNWKDNEWVYKNDLAQGNLLEVTQHSTDPDDEYKEIKTSYEYEPLYNRLRKETDPRGAVTKYEYSYDLPHSGYNGEPRIVNLPDLNLATGGKLNKLTIENTFYETGKIKSFKNTAGNLTSYWYDKNGYLITVKKPNGESDQFGRNGRGGLVRHTDNNGVLTSIKIDGFDQTTERVDDAKGFANKTSFKYDLNGNLTYVTRELKDNFIFTPLSGKSVPNAVASGELVKSWTYNILGQPTTVKVNGAGVSRITTYEYDDVGNKISVVTPSPTGKGTETTKIVYDARDLEREIIAAQGSDEQAVTTTIYNDDGRLEMGIGPSGLKTKFLYDGFNRQKKIETPSGSVIEHVIDKSGNITNIEISGKIGQTDGQVVGLLRRTEFKYDELNHLIVHKQHALNGGGEAETKYVYNRALLVEKEISPLGRTSTIMYNNVNRPVEIVEDYNATIYGYDGVGNRNMVKMSGVDLSKHESPNHSHNHGLFDYSFEYDSLGRIYKQKGPGGTTYHYYNSQGKLRGVVDEKGRLTENFYNGLGQLMRNTHGGVTKSYEYNPVGQVMEVKSPLEHEKRSFDSMGRVKIHENVLNGTKTIVSKYDEIGNPLLTIDPNGTKVTKTFNALGLPETVTVQDNQLEITARNGSKLQFLVGARNETFRYDGLGRIVQASNDKGSVVKFTYDGLGRVLSESQSLEGRTTHVVKKKYAADGSDEVVTYPKIADGIRLTRGIDSLGRIKSITGPDGLIAEYSYVGNDLGKDQVRFIEYGNGIYSLFNIDEKTRLNEIETWMPLKRIGYVWHAKATYEDKGILINESFGGGQNNPSDDISVKTIVDSLGRDIETTTKTTTTVTLGEEYTHSLSTMLKEYDHLGRVKTIAEYLSNPRNDLITYTAGDDLNLALVRTDAFTYTGGSKVDSVKTTALQDIEYTLNNLYTDYSKMPDMVVSPGLQDSEPNVSNLKIESIKEVLKDSSHTDTQKFIYDKNGNLIADDRFIYTYNYKNQLVMVYDNIKRVPYGFTQAVYFDYDALGRRIAMTHHRYNEKYLKSLVNWKPPSRDIVRFLYDGNMCIAEVVKNKLIARYYYGARPHELIRMDRRKNEDPNGKLAPYYLHVGLQGQIKFLTDENGKAFKTMSPGAPAGKRAGAAGAYPDDKTFISGTTTRNPYVSSTLRVDSFAGVQYSENNQSVQFDYRSAHETFYELDVEAFRDSITRSMNQAGIAALAGMAAPFVYGVAPIGISGLGASNMAIATALAMPIKTGIFNIGLSYGVSKIMGSEFTFEDAVISFGLGSLGASVGAAITKTAFTAMSQYAVATTIDVAAGTVVDMGWYGEGFGDALSGNIISAAITTGIGFTYARARLHTSSLCFVPGTKIKTYEGWKDIENIKIGDRVFSRNDKTGKTGYKKVARTIRTRAVELVHLRYRKRERSTKPVSNDKSSQSPRKSIDKEGEPGDDDDDEDSHLLSGTLTHPFWSIDRNDWVNMGELKIGERLLLDNEDEAVIVSLTPEKASPGEHFDTFNFEVEDWHTYFVTEREDVAAVWVHNGACGPHPSLMIPGGLRDLAMDVHAQKTFDTVSDAKFGTTRRAVKSGREYTHMKPELLKEAWGVTHTTVALARVRLRSGKVVIMGAGSSNNLSTLQKALLKDFGVKIVTRRMPTFLHPLWETRWKELGRMHGRMHAEQIIKHNLPWGARVERWGISWAGNQKGIPCKMCKPHVERLGGEIDD